jgi:hypothetical protein
MDDDIIVTLKRSNDLLMTFGNDYSDVFLPAIDEIERLRLANSDLQIHYDYARTEHYKLKAEVKRLRGSLAFISILQPFNDQSWQSHAKFINAYALDELKEKE